MEMELPDDYPVHAGYFYVVDGHIITSDVGGNVARLRQDIKRRYGYEAKIVTNCRIYLRKPNEPVNQAPWMSERPAGDKLPEKKDKHWFVNVAFTDEVIRQPVWAESHKKAVKKFTDSVQAIKDGKQPELNTMAVVRAARDIGYRITKVTSS